MIKISYDGGEFMENKLTTEQEVLDKFGWKDFRNMNSKDIVKFVSSLPDMDKEVAIKCIEQFPEFAKYGNKIVDILTKSYEHTVKTNKDLADEVIEAYREILESLKKELRKRNLTSEDRSRITREMVDVADRIAAIDNSHQHFHELVIKAASAVGMVAIAAAGALIGLKINKE